MVLLNMMGLADAFRLSILRWPPDISLVIILFVVLPHRLSDFDAHLRHKCFPDSRNLSLKCTYLLILLLMLELAGPVIEQVYPQGSKGTTQTEKDEVSRAIFFFLDHFDTSLAIIFSDRIRISTLNFNSGSYGSARWDISIVYK